MTQLRGCQLVVEDDHVGVGRLDCLFQFLKFALADVAGVVDLLPLLEHAADDPGAGGGGQALQFFEGVRADPGPVGQGDADEDGALGVDGEFVAVRVERHGRGEASGIRG